MMTKSCPKPKQIRTPLLNRTPFQAQLRQAFSTSAGRSSTRSWTWTAAALLAFSGASGFVGYQLALKRTITVDVTASSKSRFGSKQDYENAIQQLKVFFPGNAASTDPDVLLVHGFSLNDYHPGKFGISLTRVRHLIHLPRRITQYSRVPSIYTGCRQDRQRCYKIQDSCCTLCRCNQFRGPYARSSNCWRNMYRHVEYGQGFADSSCV